MCDSVELVAHREEGAEFQGDKDRYIFWNNIVPLIDSLSLRSGYRFHEAPIECNTDKHVSRSCFYRSGFFVTLVIAILFLLSSCALGFIHCGTKTRSAI